MRFLMLIASTLLLCFEKAQAATPNPLPTIDRTASGESNYALMVVIQTNYNPCVTQTAIQATATVSGGTGTLTYLWDTGATTASVTFTQNGSHSVTVTDGTGATASSTTLIQLNGQGFSIGINATKDTICFGDNTKLSASGDPGTSYKWSTGATTPAITVTPPSTTSYQLIAYRTGTSNLVQNGNFEAGNTGFFTDYAVGTGGAYGLLTQEGTYGVGKNPHLLHTDFPACTDHTTRTGNMMVVNGASQPNVNIWCQTVTVAPNTEYMFSTWLATVVADNPAILQFSIEGVPLGNPFHAPGTTCNWAQFFEIWNSGINTSAKICIVNQNTNVAGNDFALDDISMVPVCTDTAKLTVVVSKMDVSALAIPVKCNGQGGEIHVNVQNGIEPYQFSISGIVPPQTNPVLTGLPAGVYNFTVTDKLGCTANRTVTVGADPALTATAITTQPTCGLNNGYVVVNAILHGTAPYTLTLNGGAPQTGTVFGNLAPGNYTLQITDSIGCTYVQEGLELSPSLPLSAETNILKQPNCKNPGGSFQVINVQNGLQPFGYSLDGGVNVQNSPIFSNLLSGTYHVRVSDAAGCTAIDTVTLQHPDSVSFTYSTQSTTCGLSNGSIALEITHASGSVNISLNGQDKGPAFDFPGLASGTYTVVAKDTAGCVDTAKLVIASSSALTVKIDISKGKDLCTDPEITLNASAGQTWKWSNDSTAQSIQVKKGGTYHVTVHDSKGCVATDSLKIDPCSRLVMPSVFTPNNDGLNDTFGPVFTDDLTILELKIYDRWGKLIFDDIKAWDGKYNENEFPSDVLIYDIKAKLADGSLRQQRGQVTLLR
jgi:gliding motility-associated-like protein